MKQPEKEKLPAFKTFQDRKDGACFAKCAATSWGCAGAITVRNDSNWNGSAQARDAHMKWKRKIIIGLETLTKYVDKHPQAKAAFEELARQVRHPFDPTEQDLGKDFSTDPTESDYPARRFAS